MSACSSPTSMSSSCASTSSPDNAAMTQSIINTDLYYVKGMESPALSCETIDTESSDSNMCLPVLDSELHCSICNDKFTEPRILSCLHVFCEGCLDSVLSDSEKVNIQRMIEEEPATKNDDGMKNSIVCPECSQITKVDGGKVKCLSVEYLLSNLLDVVAMNTTEMACTSCKATERAVARCSDCAHYLCPNCVTAHQYMRCFDNHKVVPFEKIRNCKDEILVHKPIMCETHPDEVVKFYCYTCEETICSDCLLELHKPPSHVYDKISEITDRQKEELVSLVNESNNKMQLYEEDTTSLEAMLSDLHQQHDAARDEVERTCQKYKALIDKRKTELLQQLKSLHNSRELLIMDEFNGVEKCMERSGDACKFTERLVKLGNGAEVLKLKSVVRHQLNQLINYKPTLDFGGKLKFETEEQLFTKAVEQTFGKVAFDAPPTPRSSPDLQLAKTPIIDLDRLTTSSWLHPLNTTQTDTMAPISRAFTSLSQPLSLDLCSSGTSTAFSSLCVTPSPVAPTSSLGGLFGGHMSIQDTGTILDPGNSLVSMMCHSASPSPVMDNLDDERITAVAAQIAINEAILNEANNMVPPALRNLSPSELSRLLNGSSPNLSRYMNGSPSPSSGFASSDNLNAISRNSPSDLTLPPMNHPPPSMFRGMGGMAPYSHPGMAQRMGAVKINPMEIRCKFGQLGPGRTQFNSPHGFCLDQEEDIVVADTNNHRIQVFNRLGEFKMEFGVPGKEEGQLWFPRKVIVSRNSAKYVVCDRGNERSRMQIFNRNGSFCRKIPIRYIDIVAGLALSQQGHIVAVDSVSPTVFVIAESGELVKWFDCSDFMREPSDIAVWQNEFYVCDFKGHCVVVFDESGQFKRRIGCDSITNFPNGIDVSDHGDVLIGDSHGNRFHIAVFNREGQLLSEFECPYVKVSRCCGLKITSDGYVVTLAKNNHHVLVLNTLYIQ